MFLHASRELKTARGVGGTGECARSPAAKAFRSAEGQSRAMPDTAARDAPGGPHGAGPATAVRAQVRNMNLVNNTG